MWICDPETLQILEVNETAINTYGYSREEFLALTLLNIKGNPDMSQMQVSLIQQKSKCQHYCKDGKVLTVEVSSCPINYAGRTALQVQINDVTEKVRLERELAQKNEEVINAVLQAQENERKVIGEELHDNINQILAGISLTLSYVLETGNIDRGLLRSSVQNTNLAINEVRKLSHALVLPTNLSDIGLIACIENLLSDLRLVTNLVWRVDASEFDDNRLTLDQQTALYRIIQEQLNNILKYASATNVTITLRLCGDQINLTISDDGRGFDPGVLRKGLGLHNIANRAKLYQGHLNIRSAPGEGCSIEVVMFSKGCLLQKAV